MAEVLATEFEPFEGPAPDTAARVEVADATILVELRRA
jgi:hypothetical protein